MRPILFAALFVLLVTDVTAQRSLTHRFIKDKDGFSFPIFKSEDSTTAEKVNHYLFLSELGVFYTPHAKNIFKVVKEFDRGLYGGKQWIKPTFHTDNNRIISLELDQSACGMTCAYWSNYYTFNAGNGDRIQIKDLFTPDGFRKFSKIIARKRKANFRKQVSKLDTGMRAQYFADIDDYTVDDLHAFYIRNNAIYIDGMWHFGSKARFEWETMMTKFNLSEFKGFLNNYGKCVFGIDINSIAEYHSVSLSQVYSGTIGSASVIITLHGNSPEYISATYVYTKYGKAISLEGTYENGKIVLTEKDENYEDRAYITLSIKGSEITGTWEDAKKNRKLKVYAQKM